MIPTLISFFKQRKIVVKWKKQLSNPLEVKGGGPQGGNAGILEYISLTKGNLDFLPEDEAFKFVDDASFLEVLNLAVIGLASYNAKLQVPSDIPTCTNYLPPENFQTQTYLDTMCKWTNENEMLLNSDKSKYMLFNFCNSTGFSTRLKINNSVIQQVREARLLGVIIQDDLSWNSNTSQLVKRATSRMLILRKLKEFDVPKCDMLTIYILFIRLIIEQSSVLWSSSLTLDDQQRLERVQKIALHIIYDTDYISYGNAK